MSIKSRKFARAAVIGLMLGIAPVASAVGQEANPAPGAQQQPAGIVEASAPTPAATAQAAGSPMAQINQAAMQHVEKLNREAAEARSIEEEAAKLRPGQYLWKPERSPRGEVEIVVSLEQQKAYVYRADKLIAVSTVSTGARGHRTPIGSFTILQKNRRHFSNLYNNAPMPNMQRLTWGGIALHAGALPGYPASHGCVRLPLEFSRLLFGVTSMGGRVHIVAGSPASAAGALAFATGGARGGMQMASAR
jgi:lipoprotein-anchoring transpeptidase ErfK/SrfK